MIEWEVKHLQELKEEVQLLFSAYDYHNLDLYRPITSGFCSCRCLQFYILPQWLSQTHTHTVKTMPATLSQPIMSNQEREWRETEWKGENWNEQNKTKKYLENVGSRRKHWLTGQWNENGEKKNSKVAV